MTEHTPTPWAYRPKEHDDWGWIRDADGNLAATAQDGRVWSEQFDEYRAAKKDPYEPNAAFIIKAVNSYDALVGALRKIADAPAWGAPDRWETTPFEVRQLARDVLEQSK